MQDLPDRTGKRGALLIVKNNRKIAEKNGPRIKNLILKISEYRSMREKIFRDSKILNDWNSLVISALAVTGRVAGREDFIAIAEKATSYIFSNRDGEGRLVHIYKHRQNSLPGNLNDYAYFIQSQLDLYQAVHDTKYLQNAIDANEILLKEFYDHKNGDFYFTSSSSGAMIPERVKENYDSETPSGKAVAFMNLVRLSRLTGNKRYRTAIMQISQRGIGNNYGRNASMLLSLHSHLFPGFEIHITGERKTAQNMLQIVQKMYLPGSVLHFTERGNQQIAKYAPYTKNQKEKKGVATAYICRNFICNYPVTDPDPMKAILLEK